MSVSLMCAKGYEIGTSSYDSSAISGAQQKITDRTKFSGALFQKEVPFNPKVLTFEIFTQTVFILINNINIF